MNNYGSYEEEQNQYDQLGNLGMGILDFETKIAQGKKIWNAGKSLFQAGKSLFGGGGSAVTSAATNTCLLYTSPSPRD